jgi:hypothetical protein
MKSFKYFLLFIPLLLSLNASAQIIVEKEENRDLVAKNGVLFLPYTFSNNIGSSNFKGVGSFTFFSKSYEYPRYTLYGGTNIEVTVNGSHKWNGVVPVLKTNKAIDDSRISSKSGSGFSKKVIKTFGWGDNIKQISFSKKVDLTAKFPNEPDNSILWIANGFESPVERGEHCLVKDTLCTFSTESISKITFFKKYYTDRCPNFIDSDAGRVSIPFCVPKCNENFTITKDGETCRGMTEEEKIAFKNKKTIKYLKDKKTYRKTINPNVRKEIDPTGKLSDEEIKKKLDKLEQDGYANYLNSLRLGSNEQGNEGMEGESLSSASKILKLPKTGSDLYLAFILLGMMIFFFGWRAK